MSEKGTTTVSEENDSSAVRGPSSDSPRCCGRPRRRCLIITTIAVLIVIGVTLGIAIPLAKPELVKRAAIDKLNVTKSTREVLLGLNTYVSVVAAGLGPSIRDSPVISDDAVDSSQVDLGWVLSDADNETWIPMPQRVLEVNAENEEEIYDFAGRDPALLYIERYRLTESFGYDFIRADDFTGTTREDFIVTANFLRDERFVPLRDNPHFLEMGSSTYETLLSDLSLLPLGLDEGYLLPRPYHKWDEMISDEALSRIFWYGIGGVLILGPEFSTLYSKQNSSVIEGFAIDMTSLSDLKVRDPFRPYGFRITFDTEQRITEIFDPFLNVSLTPNSNKVDWERAKFVTKQTVAAVVTVREHLQWSHLIASNTLTRSMVIHLPPDHSIRRLLTVFTFNTNKVNGDAQEILIPNLGYVHRMSAFEFDSILNVFEDGVKKCDVFRPFSKLDIPVGVQILIEQGRFPFYTEGLAYFNIVRDLVNEWFTFAGQATMDSHAKDFYNELIESTKLFAYSVPDEFTQDNLTDMIAQLIWVVTAYHELVGTVVEYTQRPDFMGFRSSLNAVQVDTESFLLAAYLTGLTGVRMPSLVGTFPNFFGQGDGAFPWEVDVWSNFQAAIQKQGLTVVEANQARIGANQPEFRSMNPTRFECAISV